MTVGIVIGATGGIGSACARALDGSADLILLNGRRREQLEQHAGHLRSRTGVVVADIAEEAGRASIVKATADAGGEIAWLVLASGVPLRGPMPELDPKDIERTLLANLVGPTLLIRSLLDLRWTDGAGIVVIGSVSASRALPNRSVYGGSKAGLEHLARSLAADLAPRRIRVNVVAPGVIDTPFLGDQRELLDRWVRERVPLGRTGTPDEVAQVVRYLALESPAYVTGARLAVDGGAESLA
ncbi:MAG TPA: SDR family oxidoreductase [Candidatus Limnocylindrales bacterium]|nr:SDR family oxidoreductase [Candidatus Limnocylindrales bacterium]